VHERDFDDVNSDESESISSGAYMDDDEDDPPMPEESKELVLSPMGSPD